MKLNQGAKNGEVYTGIVIDNNPAAGYNPIQVWVPSLNPGYVFGEWNVFGSNTGSSIDSETLDRLRAVCGDSSMFYRSIPCSMGSEAMYIESLRRIDSEYGGLEIDRTK